MKLDTALKEWAVVCDLLAEGRCCLLLRKGGVHEHAGPGRFELIHDRFLMFPAWEHERLDWIKPDWLPPEVGNSAHEGGEGEPEWVTFRAWAEVARIWQVPSRSVFDQLEDLHPWAAPQLDMRFNYKPDRPLYLMALRVYRLDEPVSVPNREAFGGCVSWVPLSAEDAVDTSRSKPTMPPERFTSILERVARVLSG
ncbi:MAG: DUF1802 family protein [Planctomycetota bacterium]